MKPAGLRFLLTCGLVAAVAVVGYWLAVRRHADGGAATARLHGGIKPVAVGTHQALPSTAPDGKVRLAPALPSLEKALGLESRLAFALRLEVVHALDVAKLDDRQADQLLAFVAEKRLPAGLSASQLLALKNDVLNVLVLRPASAAAVVAALRAIHDDPSQDAGLRDYALQAMAELSVTAGTEPQWRAVQGQDSALAATAMLQLLSFSREGKLSAADKTRLAQAAAKLAADATQPETSRATALQVCGQLKFAEARSVAWATAHSDKAGYPFRIAAIATLGDLGGDTQTQAYLRQLAVGREKRLRVPAQSALKRFSIIN
jgi:hypothetical protein